MCKVSWVVGTNLSGFQAKDKPSIIVMFSKGKSNIELNNIEQQSRLVKYSSIGLHVTTSSCFD